MLSLHGVNEMSFTSIWFLPFLAIIFILYHSVPMRYRYIILCLANGIFFMGWGIRCAITLFIITFITYVGGLVIDKTTHRKGMFITFLIITTVVYLSFKFQTMFTNLWRVLGISFYSLQAIGYLVDVYFKKTKAEKNILKYASYISFFPTIISGPIQRSTGLLMQIQNGTVFSYDLARSGALMMLLGYFEKILIADRIHILIEPIFAEVYSQNGAALLFGCLMYGIELYADFAGYSMIAIGASRMLGFILEDNFRQPYFSISIRDFWRRWHISLSTWLRDYVYIPLGGNRKGTVRKYINLMVTFLISGIWHGNGFKYIAWGLLHGLYQVAGSVKATLFHQKAENKSITNIIIKTIKCLFTFILVQFGWIFFRADSLKDVFVICKRIICDLHLSDTLLNRKYLAGYDMTRFIILIAEIIILFVIDLLREKNISLIRFLEKRHVIFRWSFYILVTTIVLIGAIYNYGIDSSTFIYAQF